MLLVVARALALALVKSEARMQVTDDCDRVENLRKQIDGGQDSARELDNTPAVRIAAGLTRCSRQRCYGAAMGIALSERTLRLIDGRTTRCSRR